MDAYWNSENNEIKYQLGEGCAIDQQLGQWHASLCGLGDILNPDNSRKALESVFRYNYKKTLRHHFNPCRIYAAGKESTTIICDYPEGKQRPLIPVPYAEEGWPGCEYQAASHMMMKGMLQEGLTLVSAVRRRFTGEKRNPWNEFECGSNYARSMSSYALLLALSGFRFDMTKGYLGFLPNDPGEARCYFWSVEGAYGLFRQEGDQRTLQVCAGQLMLRCLETDRPATCAFINQAPVTIREEGNKIFFDEALCLKAGDKVVLN